MVRQGGEKTERKCPLYEDCHTIVFIYEIHAIIWPMEQFVALSFQRELACAILK